MPNGLFTSERCRRCIHRIIEDLELQRQDQTGIDAIYDELLESQHTEMDIYLDYKDSTASTHKSSRKHKKPYWNDELRDLWLRTGDSEKVYLNFRGDHGHKRDLQTKYVNARKTFDKAPDWWPQTFLGGN